MKGDRAGGGGKLHHNRSGHTCIHKYVKQIIGNIGHDNSEMLTGILYIIAMALSVLKV